MHSVARLHLAQQILEVRRVRGFEQCDVRETSQATHVLVALVGGAIVRADDAGIGADHLDIELVEAG